MVLSTVAASKRAANAGVAPTGPAQAVDIVEQGNVRPQRGGAEQEGVIAFLGELAESAAGLDR